MIDSDRKQFERLTAFKCFIKEIINGSYHKMEGWDPNYVLSPLGKNLARVNIIAAVISLNKGAEGKTIGINIDDGSGQISLRVFDNIGMFEGLDIGNIVQIIGKPREYNAQRYLVPEIIKKVSKDWLLVRKMEFEAEYGTRYKEIGKAAVQAKETSADENTNIHDSIMEYLKKNDNGDGVDFETIISNISDSEKIIDNLLRQGEIFEIRPGRLKVL